MSTRPGYCVNLQVMCSFLKLPPFIRWADMLTAAHRANNIWYGRLGASSQQAGEFTTCLALCNRPLGPTPMIYVEIQWSDHVSGHFHIYSRGSDLKVRVKKLNMWGKKEFLQRPVTLQESTLKYTWHAIMFSWMQPTRNFPSCVSRCHFLWQQ